MSGHVRGPKEEWASCWAGVSGYRSSLLLSLSEGYRRNRTVVSWSSEGYGGINEIPMLGGGLKAAESKLVSSGAMCGRIIFGEILVLAL